MSHRALSLAGLLTLSPALAASQVLVGPEFRVNTYTTSPQLRPSAAADAAGNFIVVWESASGDGNGYGVFARLHDASGAPLGASEFRVNAWTTGQQRAPQVAGTAGGLFVVVWESQGGQDGSGSGIFARRFDAAGSPLGAEFQVNTYATGDQADAAVAVDAAGNFVVVWESAGADGSDFGIRARRFNAAGQAQGDEFQVNSYSTAAQRRPAVASDATGNFVMAWQSLRDPDTYAGVYAQRYDALGAPVGGEFRVNSYTSNGQGSPVVASDATGNFVVVWLSVGQDAPGGYGVFGQRYDAAGSPLGGEFGLNGFTTGNQFVQSIALGPGGHFAVVWGSSGDGSGVGVFGRLFDAAGVADGPDFQFNTYTTGNQTLPAVAVDGSGRFVVAWSSLNQDGSSYGVYAQRFGRDLIFRDGFEDGTMGAWSTSATDGGDLSVSVFAGLKFTAAGLRGVVDDTAGIFVEDQSPADENRYRARFYFHTNGFDPGETLGRFRARLFLTFEENPIRRLAAIVLRRIGGQYSLMGRARLDDNSQYNTGFFPIADGAHFVELDWRRASGPDANDGSFELWIDGASVHAAATLDNSLSAVDFVRLGALSVKVGATGTLYWDEFESRRQGAIGP